MNKFTKPVKTDYKKKKPARLIIESDSEEVKPKNKPKFIIEESTPVSPEEFILEKKKKQTRKKVVIRGNKNKTVKQNQPKRKLLIADSSTTEKDKLI